MTKHPIDPSKYGKGGERVDSDAPITRPALLILQSVRRMIREVDRYSRSLKSGFGLTGPQLACLAALCDVGPMTQKALSDIVSVGASTVSGVVDRLEAAGLVLRLDHPHDRRKFLVTPTEAGRELRARAPSVLQSRLAKNLQDLPFTEQEEIANALCKLVALMQEETVPQARESARLAAVGTKPR